MLGVSPGTGGAEVPLRIFLTVLRSGFFRSLKGFSTTLASVFKKKKKIKNPKRDKDGGGGGVGAGGFGPLLTFISVFNSFSLKSTRINCVLSAERGTTVRVCGPNSQRCNPNPTPLPLGKCQRPKGMSGHPSEKFGLDFP